MFTPVPVQRNTRRHMELCQNVPMYLNPDVSEMPCSTYITATLHFLTLLYYTTPFTVL